MANVPGALSTRANLEAEQSLLGAVLIEPDKIMPELMGIVSEDDFLGRETKQIYRICRRMYLDRKAIDFVTVLSETLRAGVFSDEGDAKVYLSDLAQIVPSLANWKNYADLVVDAAKRFRAFDKIDDLAAMLAAKEKVSVCREKAVELCEALSTTTSGDSVSAKEGFLSFYAGLQHNPNYIRTGFAHIDRMTYISPGDFVIIGARPSVGKTAFTLQLMATMSKERRVAYFSLETGKNNLFGRLSAHIGKIPLGRIKTREGLDFRGLARVYEMMDKLDFYVIEAAGWTVDEIRAKSIQLGVEVIFVDYIGLVKADGASRYEKVTNISQGLHTMAQQTGIAVFGLSQLNREGNGRPSMANLRESGQIEQDADVVMILHAPRKDEEDQNQPQERELYIEKNKEGQVGDIRMKFYGGTQTFAEVEKRYGG